MQNELSLDELLTEKIKFGKSQLIILSVLLILNMSDGAETIIIGFVQPQIKTYWGISDTYMSLNITLIFLGILLGALVTGKISDRIGRRKPLLLACLGIFSSAILSATAQSFLTYILTRGMFGFFMGVSMALYAGYATEILPQNVRAKWIAFIAYGFALGELLGVFLSYIFLDSQEKGNWRLVLIFASLPSLLAIPLCYKYVPESPRYLLLVKNDKKKAIQILEHMNYLNNSQNEGLVSQQQQNEGEVKDQYKFTSQEKKGLERWADNYYKNQQGKKASYKELFNKKNRKLTQILTVVWFSLSLLFYGLNITIPQLLLKEQQQNASQDQQNQEFQENTDNNNNNNNQEQQIDGHNYIGILCSIFISLPAILFVQLVVDNKEIGRKNLIFLGYLVTGLLSFLIYLLGSVNFLFYVCVGGMKFFLEITIIVLYPFTSEIYETGIRITGMGYTNCISRGGGMLVSWILILGFNLFGNYGPFLMLSLFAFISTIGAYFIPKDTTNMKLDTYQEQIDIDDKIKQTIEL